MSNTLRIFQYLYYCYSTSDRSTLNPVTSDVLCNIYESKKQVFIFVLFPQGFFAFNFSYLTWKPMAIGTLHRPFSGSVRDILKAPIPKYYLPFSLDQLMKTYPFMFLCTAWYNTEKITQKYPANRLSARRKKNSASQAGNRQILSSPDRSRLGECQGRFENGLTTDQA